MYGARRAWTKALSRFVAAAFPKGNGVQVRRQNVKHYTQSIPAFSSMAKTIKEHIAKSVKKSVKPKSTKSEPVDWYAKAKASIAINKTPDPTKDQ